MSTTKSILYLLVVVVAYGIAGHLDYEDALMLEEIERKSIVVVTDDCLEFERVGAAVLPHPHGLRDTGLQSLLDSERPDAVRPCHDSGH